MWKEVRKENGHKNYKARGEQCALSRISKWGYDRALAAVVYSTAQGYQGVFEERTHNRPDGPDNPTYSAQKLFEEIRTGKLKKLQGRPVHSRMQLGWSRKGLTNGQGQIIVSTEDIDRGLI